jgi:hypothetical protein
MYITYSTMDSLLCHSISISKNKRTVKEKIKKTILFWKKNILPAGINK